MIDQIAYAQDSPRPSVSSDSVAGQEPSRTLFLAWQDKVRTRLWFPIGRLDVYAESPKYRFRYTCGAERARQEAGFQPLLDFPRFEKDYRSTKIFPLFQNRIMSPRRPDFRAYLLSLELAETAAPIEILAASGGYRATDSYAVFPKILKGDDGSFACRFFLHGLRYVSQTAQDRLDSLERDENLVLAIELNNPTTGLAVQIQTTDYHVLGWAPRYLAEDLTAAMSESPDKYEARVVRVNRKPYPIIHRLLIEMRGFLDKREPMSGETYTPFGAGCADAENQASHIS